MWSIPDHAHIASDAVMGSRSYGTAILQDCCRLFGMGVPARQYGGRHLPGTVLIGLVRMSGRILGIVCLLPGYRVQNDDACSPVLGELGGGTGDGKAASERMEWGGAIADFTPTHHPNCLPSCTAKHAYNLDSKSAV